MIYFRRGSRQVLFGASIVIVLYTMEGFDDAGIFFSDNFGNDDNRSDTINLQTVKKKFKDFLREFHEGNFNYKYRLEENSLTITSYTTCCFYSLNFFSILGTH